MFTAFDLLLSIANLFRADGHDLDSGPSEQFIAIKAALKRPDGSLWLVTEQIRLLVGCPHLEVLGVGFVPAVLDTGDFVRIILTTYNRPQ